MTYILGSSQTDFARAWSREGLDISDMIRASVLDALEDAQVDASQVGSIHVGNAFGEMQREQAHLGAMVAQVVPELWGVPAMRHEGACASASLAVLTAMAEIEAGRYDCVLVVGAEEFKNTRGDIASVNQNAAGWQGHEGIECKFLWPAVFGLAAQEYDRRYGLDRRYLNRIAEINYGNAKRNPLAQTRGWAFNALSFTDDDNANPIIEPGTRRQDCGQITDGASSLVLASAAFAADWSRRTGKRAAKIAGWGHHNAGLRFKDKLAHSGDYVFPHVRQTIEDAWRRAGVSGIEAMSGVETHDCFTTTEYIAIDHLGLTAPGQSWQAVEDGIIEPGGRCPVNMSGGLIGCGHPVGATGSRMLHDAARQVLGRAGDMQIDGASRIQTLNIGGSFGTVVSFVVEAQ
ncbi:MAG: thiolase domain-containing protein [Rhodobacter sp.]|uniref:acetyl-CoA acetyltransferase n=1 Tax=Pararhodobacter sp. TaxID=2127056 RepID=UPI001D53E3C6|nr:acetyl-CoA acetyltransferase [Pararhodobacter sp.]MCB1345197.1 thiolase domain-containing protein [Paracoccaceae bacterium]MCC0072271.1 thiolase domain-containing protein [Rhodobacter sp.]HPD93164.1 acetyl-CoA acetyltransferase [Pararhodobacter sp.]